MMEGSPPSRDMYKTVRCNFYILFPIFFKMDIEELFQDEAWFNEEVYAECEQVPHLKEKTNITQIVLYDTLHNLRDIVVMTFSLRMTLTNAAFISNDRFTDVSA